MLRICPFGALISCVVTSFVYAYIGAFVLWTLSDTNAWSLVVSLSVITVMLLYFLRTRNGRHRHH